MKIALTSGKLLGSKESNNNNSNNKQSGKDIKLLDDRSSVKYGKGNK